MTLIGDRSGVILRRVLESEYSARSDRTISSPMDAATINADKANFKKLQDGYNACMDEDLIAQRGLRPMLKLVREIKDIFPVTESSEKSKPGSTTDAITYLQELGLAGFIDFGISVRVECPTSFYN